MSPACTLRAGFAPRTRCPMRGHLRPIKYSSLSPVPVLFVKMICHRTCELISDTRVPQDGQGTATVALYFLSLFLKRYYHLFTFTRVLPAVAVSGAHHRGLDPLPVARCPELPLADRVGHDGEIQLLHDRWEGPPRKQHPPSRDPARLTLVNNEEESEGFLDSDTLIGFLH